MGREHIPRTVSSAGKTMIVQAAGVAWKVRRRMYGEKRNAENE